jgi:hypothetical protein
MAEVIDGYRYLRLSIKSWTVYSGSEKHEQEEINPFSVKGMQPFTNTREEWIIDETKIAIDKLTDEMIDEFGARGIVGPPGKNIGSIDWKYKIINAIFRWVSKVDLDQLELLKKKLVEYENKLADLKNRLVGQNKTILRFRGVTEEEEPDVKKFVKAAKKARDRFRDDVRVQKTIIERQKKAVDDFKIKIGMDWE